MFNKRRDLGVYFLCIFIGVFGTHLFFLKTLEHNQRQKAENCPLSTADLSLDRALVSYSVKVDCQQQTVD